MKYLIHICITLLVVLSCNKNDVQKSNLLIGKWQLTKIETEQVAHAGTDKTTIPIENTFYQFSKEGTVKYFSKDGSVKEYVYSYNAEDNTLTIGSTISSVKEFTKTSLIFYTTTQFLDGTASSPDA